MVYIVKPLNRYLFVYVFPYSSHMLTFFSASCENPHTSRTKVGIKRNWKIANQADTPDPALTSLVRKDTLRHTCKRVGEFVITFTCEDLHFPLSGNLMKIKITPS